MGIRILSLCLLCAGALRAESIRCAAGETVQRSGATLVLSKDHRAALTVEGPCRVHLSDLTIQGHRESLRQPQPLPPSDRRFAEHYRANGILIIGAAELIVTGSSFQNIAGFAILASGVGKAHISRCAFRDSGSLNAKGKNNTTGGVLLEDGTANFTVEDSEFANISGNAVWTHSGYNRVRNGPGSIVRNRFETIGRDAIQIGHASRVEVRENVIRRVGYPFDVIDVDGGGTPVGIDTAGNVDSSVYAANRLSEINGKCIDLDGFHHGAVTANTCVNTGAAEDYPFGHFGIVMNNANPDMQSVGIRIEDNRLEGMRFGGIFVIGSGHIIRRNTMLRLHTSRCIDNSKQPDCTHFEDEPDLLRSGIYLGRHAERPAVTRNNIVEANQVSGWRMDRYCIGRSPGIAAASNRIGSNICRHQAIANGRP